MKRGLLIVLLLAGCSRPSGEAVQTRDTAMAYAQLPADTGSDPSSVLRRYFAAVQRKDYKTAWDLWEDRGPDSRPTLQQFAAGFARTERLRALVSDSVRMEGAAGSQYVTVPVVIDAVLNGVERHYAGSYTLRRAMVDGATAEQRQWRLYSATMSKR